MLVIDDCEEDVALLQRAFLKAGLGVTLHTARDGEEAIEYLEGKGKFRDRSVHPMPRLVLLDLKMPKMDGFDVLAWLSNHPKLKCLPVTVFSSSSQRRDIDRAYELGANSYLCKPSNLKEYGELAELLHSYWLKLNFPHSCAS